MVLDTVAEGLANQLANQVYGACRSQSLKLPNFPDFQPLLDSLKAGLSEEQPQDYQVCRQIGDALVILGVFAQKWLEGDLKDRALQVISDHNKKFNPNEPPGLPAGRAAEADPWNQAFWGRMVCLF